MVSLCFFKTTLSESQRIILISGVCLKEDFLQYKTVQSYNIKLFAY